MRGFCLAVLGIVAPFLFLSRAESIIRFKPKDQPATLTSLPFSRNKLIFTNRLLSPTNAAFCVQNGPEGVPRVLLDTKQDPYLLKYPIDNFSVSDDGRYAVYFVPQIPHRFEEIRLVDVSTGKILPDDLRWTYLSDLAWHGDGYFYGRYPAPADPSIPTQNGRPEDHQKEAIYYHKVGNASSKDSLVFEDLAHPGQKFLFLESFDHKWMHVHIMDPKLFGKVSSEWFCHSSLKKLELTAIQPLMLPGRFFLCSDLKDKFLFYTNFRSPQGRIILVDSHAPLEPNWKTVIPESNESMETADPAAGKLLVTYKLSSGYSRVEIRTSSGKFEKILPLPLETTAEVEWSGPKEKDIYLSTQTKNGSKIYWRYLIESGKLVRFY